MTDTATHVPHDVTDLSLAAEGAAPHRVGRARDARPAPDPRALRAREAPRRPPDRRLPPRHHRDREPDADAQGRRRRRPPRGVEPAVDPGRRPRPRWSPSYGIATFARRGEDRDTYYATSARSPTSTRRSRWTTAATSCRCSTSERRDQLPEVLAGTEETTTGVIRLRAMAADNALAFPVVAVNEAADQAPVRQPLRHRASRRSTGSCGRRTSSSPAATSSSPATAGWAAGSRPGWTATAPTSR